MVSMDSYWSVKGYWKVRVACLIVLAVMSVVVLTGCGQVTAGEGEISAIRIGITVDDANPMSGAVNTAFLEALEEFIGIPVIGMEDVTYLVGIEAMRAGNLDIMLASAFNYVSAKQVVDVEILTMVPMDSSSNTIFITRADRDDINSVEDLEGQTFAFVNAASTSGYIFPKYHLVRELGADPQLVTHSGHFFSAVTFSGGHDTSLMGVNFGDFDGAAVVSSIIDSMAGAGIINPDDIKIIGETAPFPTPAYLIRSELPNELIEQIREFFLAFDDADYFYTVWGEYGAAVGRYLPPDADGFAYVESMVAALGLEN